MKFEENLRELRKRAGLSQEDLAERLNVSRQAVSKCTEGVKGRKMVVLILNWIN